jgi:hypothetical protein
VLGAGIGVVSELVDVVVVVVVVVVVGAAVEVVVVTGERVDVVLLCSTPRISAPAEWLVQVVIVPCCEKTQRQPGLLRPSSARTSI